MKKIRAVIMSSDSLVSKYNKNTDPRMIYGTGEYNQNGNNSQGNKFKTFENSWDRFTFIKDEKISAYAFLCTITNSDNIVYYNKIELFASGLVNLIGIEFGDIENNFFNNTNAIQGLETKWLLGGNLQLLKLNKVKEITDNYFNNINNDYIKYFHTFFLPDIETNYICNKYIENIYFGYKKNHEWINMNANISNSNIVLRENQSSKILENGWQPNAPNGSIFTCKSIKTLKDYYDYNYNNDAEENTKKYEEEDEALNKYWIDCLKKAIEASPITD